MSKTTTHVSFVCQKCSQPIKLNKSLQARNLMGVAKEVESKLGLEWSGEEPQTSGEEPQTSPARPSISEREESSLDFNLSSLPRASPLLPKPIKHSRSGLETVSVLYDSLPSAGAASTRADSRSTLKQIQIATETFKMLSEHSDIDHPLCGECPESALDSYDRQISHTEEAGKLYSRMAAKLSAEVEGYREEMGPLEEELETLHKEEEALKAKLSRTEAYRREIADEMSRQQERESELKEEEQQYWREFNDHQQKLLAFKDDQLSVQYQLQYTSDQLSVLKKTNVFNTVFHIWHNGHFGTINGLRLGRLQTVPVEWSEINAAWGQTAFLLSTLARVAGLRFERYKVVPYGNQSFIEVMEGKRRILPLYSSPGLRLWTDLKFDTAMMAFLDCLGQLKAHIESCSSPKFVLPYTIDKDQVGDGKEFYSIRTQFNTPEKWTKALKFVLTNLRWALTWVTANSLQPEADST